MNNANETETGFCEQEITIGFFITVIRKCWVWILLVAVAFSLFSGIYTAYFVDKTYSSTTKLYVNANFSMSSGQYNYDAAQQLALTYPTVLRYSDEFAKAVALDMAKLTEEGETAMFPDWTYKTTGDGEETADNWGAVQRKMTAGTIEGKEIVYITMSSTDPKEAYWLAYFAAQEAPAILNEIVGTGKISRISAPVLDTAADAPSLLRNVAIAGIGGALLTFLIFFLKEYFDTTLYSEDDLKKYGLPVLGVVPSFPEIEKSRKPGSKLSRPLRKG